MGILVLALLCGFTAWPTVAMTDDPVQVCQTLQPSPTLEQFVDKLPKLKQIRIDHGKQVILGAYKIKQVRTYIIFSLKLFLLLQGFDLLAPPSRCINSGDSCFHVCSRQ